MPRSHWLVVGISGITCSGKTTLANKLNSSLEDSVVLHQDEYFFPEYHPSQVRIPSINHNNWDLTTSVDMERLYTDATNVLKLEKKGTKKRTLILDGFLIFNYKPLADLCDLRYFIDLTRDVCWERRQTRAYDPPDVPGYFDIAVYPEYEKHKAEILDDVGLKKSVVFLDGAGNKDELFQRLFVEIKSKLSTAINKN